jgi:GT2 family glycosyltransferase/SAM-dependent methyltransferase
MILKEEKGTAVYSDGNETEQQMLEIAKQYPGDTAQDYIADCSEYTVNNTFSSVRENILNWYPFKKDCTILEIGAGMGAITGMLCDKAKAVTAVEMNSVRAEVIKTRYAERKNLNVIVQNIEKLDKTFKFDYVIMVGVLEYSEVFFDVKEPFKYMLELAKSHLNKDGIILCAIENRFGLKYWCGASEDHLQQPFIGINGYSKDKSPKTLSKDALSHLFDSAGLLNKRFYYVLPDYKFPKAIYTDDYLPIPQDIDNIPFTYSKGSMLHTKEQALYSEIIKNHTFDFFANSYLVEASVKKLHDYRINFVSARGEAKKEYRSYTTIDNENKAIKYPAHPKSVNHIKNIYDNYLYLTNKGIKQIDQLFENNKLSSDIVPYKRADLAFDEALVTNNLKQIYFLIDKLKENLLKSSDFELEKNILVDLGYFNKDEYKGAILKYGFIDMTFYNAFVVNDELVFFDQEWKIENIPLNFILYYAIKIAYNRAKTAHAIDIKDLLHYAGVAEYFDEFDKLESYIWSMFLYRTGDVYGKDGYCNQYNDNLTLEHRFEQFNQEIINRDEHIEQLMESERRLEGEVISKTGHIEQLMESMDNLNIELNNKTGHIELLLESERRLANDINSIFASRTWKLASKISLISKKLFPLYSKRRFFAKLVYKFLKNPFKFLFKITPKRIFNFFHVLKTEGTAGASRRINNHMANKKIPEYSQDINLLTNMSDQTNIDDYKSIEFRKENKPVVSIIIPVYNQFNYTYNCLKSIIDHSGGKINYEIIIANDCSTDLTTQIEKTVKNIKVITTTKNVRFLKNCNNAAKHAKGKYILFLNNDIQVQENWLLPLVELIEKDDKIGAVGSKLVYENGMLQEAGGIFWNDASAWNYGKMGDPALPEYNYVKEVDYISGAALMIKKTMWDKLGGFDEEFAPAYYEDSDICFSIRKLGYKVLYQPLSVVVHFEGITNGTDVSEGQKQYQIVNQKKFFDKWKNVLEKEYSPNGENIFLARDRSRKEKTILFVDHYVPWYDKDAGSRAAFHYLSYFVSLGFNVKFIGDNFYKHEPYTTVLTQMGIEVLYGSYYAENWKTWLKTNGQYIDFVILSRPHISVKYIDDVRKCTKAKIFYYGHDLHFLRESREYGLTKDKEKLKSSVKWKELELTLMRKSDISYFFSTVEIELIKEIDPYINCKVIPINIYPKTSLQKFDNNRKNLIYVGGFGHSPNIDALIWFDKSIMPLIRKAIPNIILYVIGSNVPEEIKRLEKNDVKILGYLDDKSLDEYYKKCRISVVPLRYGAGVKGKVIEAMYKQIPIITTSIGAEGLPDIKECLIVEDNEEKFAEKLINMYNNYELLEELTKKSYNYIIKNFTIDKVKNIFDEDFK